LIHVKSNRFSSGLTYLGARWAGRVQCAPEGTMRANQWVTSVSIIAIGALTASVPLLAQEITGKPGSPEATTTVPGNQLPPPPQKFEGKIERNAAQSTPYWPMRVVPPKGAPNILLIMTDDTGFRRHQRVRRCRANTDAR